MLCVQCDLYVPGPVGLDLSLFGMFVVLRQPLLFLALAHPDGPVSFDFMRPCMSLGEGTREREWHSAEASGTDWAGV